MAEDARVAVYIDFDNVVISRYNQLHGRGAFQNDRVRHLVTDAADADPAVVGRMREATVDIGAILDYASSFGTIVVSQAYADWSQPVNADYRRQLIDRAVDLTQLFPLSATKNGADIRLAIDVVEDLFRLPDVTHVVLAAGDSDYVALAQRVRRLGRSFVAVGVAGATSRALPAACTEFALYDDLPGVGAEEHEAEVEPEPPAVTTDPGSAAAPAAPEREASDLTVAEEFPREEAAGDEAVKMSARAATRLLRRALELVHDKAGADEWLNASVVKQQMKRLDPSFHEKSLGYRSFSDFLRSRASVVELDKKSHGQRVRLRQAG